jgi:hypothetical protein
MWLLRDGLDVNKRPVCRELIVGCLDPKRPWQNRPHHRNPRAAQENKAQQDSLSSAEVGHTSDCVQRVDRIEQALLDVLSLILRIDLLLVPGRDVERIDRCALFGENLGQKNIQT